MYAWATRSSCLGKRKGVPSWESRRERFSDIFNPGGHREKGKYHIFRAPPFQPTQPVCYPADHRKRKPNALLKPIP